MREIHIVLKDDTVELTSDSGFHERTTTHYPGDAVGLLACIAAIILNGFFDEAEAEGRSDE